MRQRSSNNSRALPIVQRYGPRIFLAMTSLAGCVCAPVFAHEPEPARQGEERRATAPALTRLSSQARAVVRALEIYAAAVSSNDLARIRPLLVADADFSYFEGSFANFGWQSYYDHLAPEMAMFDQPHYRVSEIRPFVSGQLAYATFSWAMDVTVVSDKVAGRRHPVSMTGMGTVVLSRIAGQWKIRHLQTATARAKRDNSNDH